MMAGLVVGAGLADQVAKRVGAKITVAAGFALLTAGMAAGATTVPAIRARGLDEFGRTIQVIADMVGERAGRGPDDLAARTLAGAVLGVAMTMWFAASDDLEDFATKLDQGLALLKAGLPL
jgi:MftR C-terminal domain